jgi:hypothetical protein
LWPESATARRPSGLVATLAGKCREPEPPRREHLTGRLIEGALLSVLFDHAAIIFSSAPRVTLTGETVATAQPLPGLYKNECGPGADTVLVPGVAVRVVEHWGPHVEADDSPLQRLVVTLVLELGRVGHRPRRGVAEALLQGPKLV